jgi:hypothetical protein
MKAEESGVPPHAGTSIILLPLNPNSDVPTVEFYSKYSHFDLSDRDPEEKETGTETESNANNTADPDLEVDIESQSQFQLN